jgi:hypothetical protein
MAHIFDLRVVNSIDHLALAQKHGFYGMFKYEREKREGILTGKSHIYRCNFPLKPSIFQGKTSSATGIWATGVVCSTSGEAV